MHSAKTEYSDRTRLVRLGHGRPGAARGNRTELSLSAPRAPTVQSCYEVTRNVEGVEYKRVRGQIHLVILKQ